MHSETPRPERSKVRSLGGEGKNGVRPSRHVSRRSVLPHKGVLFENVDKFLKLAQVPTLEYTVGMYAVVAHD